MYNQQIKFPEWTMKIKYNYDIIPQSYSQNIIKLGANCQTFACEFLKFNNLYVPLLRSSELWKDTKYSMNVIEYRPLDVLFLNSKPEAYGAHIVVYLGENKVIHNSKKVGGVSICTIDSLLNEESYKYIIGGKRFIKKL